MAELHHTWRYEGNNGRHWVHHSSRDQRGTDSIGIGLGEDILGPFPTRKLALQVANALTNAHRAGWAERDALSDDPDNCDECAVYIPIVNGGGLANRHHDESCSLYDPDKD